MRSVISSVRRHAIACLLFLPVNCWAPKECPGDGYNGTWLQRTLTSALQSVKGVKEAKVSLERNEAVVTYDPDVVKVEDLIKAVKSARGMNSYDAKIKKK